ncbi:hypothetical protein PGT21_029235 [Puccinia graminis f. sp. tritici]|uniref:Uncharacterized protein n=2 Tax=Puccinia graminis f. sp. tritici TaxID=56615 RepID=E3KRF7_PUCGT|nr:uncharacterized protein PGTG_12623 [Puccinia graminis f. sp. tritici CRL 75-36-700-3]EFP86882.1 hypothetical protein PGTG_12623 [Puccinia graminis f. sp. tritici CRL 75-36-700-3]KAA1101754.1 hypothetical protein PGT21_029235 [Puccinia graminis f. sp. tritici]KAA1136226.1 hypothetical protein PGTUg99_007205 [Puccinia graminis f. sp. tritici]
MDTDWCIVCDTRIYPSISEARKVSKTSNGMAEVVGGSTTPSSSSAFCSTGCLIKAYHEAELYNPLDLPPQALNIQLTFPHQSSHPRSSLIHPKQKACKDRPKSRLINDHNSQNLKINPNERKLISQFTFGSYGTSSLSSSDALRFINTKC